MLRKLLLFELGVAVLITVDIYAAFQLSP